jgi:Tol biopolymer transport system component
MLVPAAAAGHVSAARSTGLRILYASDWTGPTEIFAADPSGRTPIRQVTLARPNGGCREVRPSQACGYTRPQPSPDGRWLAYWSVGEEQALWLARANGMRAREIRVAYDADWSPDSRSLVYSAKDGIHVATTAGADRIVYRAGAGAYFRWAHWSPDGGTIAFAAEFAAKNGLILLRGGHARLLTGDNPESLAWSPDGRQIAYATDQGISFISTRTGTRSAQLVYTAMDHYHFFYYGDGWGLTFSPDGRLIAFLDGAKVGFIDVRTGRVRTFRVEARDIAWAPDGSRLLIVRGSDYLTGGLTGDLQTLTPSGHTATVVSASGAYGGQIDAAAWSADTQFAYTRPQDVTGVFAGGPVQELVADGDRVAFVSCGAVSTAVPTTGEVSTVATLSGACPAHDARYAYVASLALAGDRLVWWVATLGNTYGWSVNETTLGGSPTQVAHGGGFLGSTPSHGAGTAVGSGSLLAISTWTLLYKNGSRVVDQQAIQRVEPAGCPCQEISSSPGPYEPLDVNENRIVASGNNETRILAADGTILLSLPVPTLAAQLNGSQLVLASGDTLRVYDAGSGALEATWPLSAGPAGHDCDIYADPSCDGFGWNPSVVRPVALEDVAHGLATYILNGQVHLLRLSDGADRVVAPGTLARFINAGLVYADGARIWLTPYDQLPLQ